MVITSRTQTTLFTASPTASPNSSKTLIRLPLSVVPHYEQRCEVTGAIVPTANKPLFRVNLWSSDEHERFLRGLEIFPNGPWKEVAKVVGTKTTRQTMTHAQKYRQKIERHQTMQPKQPTRKSRLRKLRRATQQISSVRATGDLHPHEMMRSFLFRTTPTPVNSNVAATCASVGQEHALASPPDVQSDVFDVSFLDQEFDAILASCVSWDQKISV